MILFPRFFHSNFSGYLYSIDASTWHLILCLELGLSQNQFKTRQDHMLQLLLYIPSSRYLAYIDGAPQLRDKNQDFKLNII